MYHRTRPSFMQSRPPFSMAMRVWTVDCSIRVRLWRQLCCTKGLPPDDDDDESSNGSIHRATWHEQLLTTSRTYRRQQLDTLWCVAVHGPSRSGDLSIVDTGEMSLQFVGLYSSAPSAVQTGV